MNDEPFTILDSRLMHTRYTHINQIHGRKIARPVATPYMAA
jgi:hypothetical protein